MVQRPRRARFHRTDYNPRPLTTFARRERRGNRETAHPDFAQASNTRRIVRLVIQIPCLDEAPTLPATIGDLPTALPDIDDIRVIVIDDGSTDQSGDIAASLGASVVRLPQTRGLAAAFSAGIDAGLSAGPTSSSIPMATTSIEARISLR